MVTNLTVHVDNTMPTREIASEHYPAHDAPPAVFRVWESAHVRVKAIETEYGTHKVIVENPHVGKTVDETLYEGDKHTAACVFRAVVGEIDPFTFTYPDDLDTFDLEFVTVERVSVIDSLKERLNPSA